MDWFSTYIGWPMVIGSVITMAGCALRATWKLSNSLTLKQVQDSSLISEIHTLAVGVNLLQTNFHDHCVADLREQEQASKERDDMGKKLEAIHLDVIATKVQTA